MSGTSKLVRMMAQAAYDVGYVVGRVERSEPIKAVGEARELAGLCARMGRVHGQERYGRWQIEQLVGMKEVRDDA